jgi:DNA-binding transcriptional regulator YhcF (GntR family)
MAGHPIQQWGRVVKMVSHAALVLAARRPQHVREQLATQIVLAIVSGELAPGQRLPSTRELARRFRLHPNTLSAGYKQLEESN